jgi:hypothetical protein
MPTSCIVRAGRRTLLSLCPSGLTRSWRNDPGPRIHAAGEAVEWDGARPRQQSGLG